MHQIQLEDIFLITEKYKVYEWDVGYFFSKDSPKLQENEKTGTGGSRLVYCVDLQIGATLVSNIQQSFEEVWTFLQRSAARRE